MPTNEKIVLLAYADHARADGTCIFPSIGLLARKTGYSEREVQRITRRLSRYLMPDGKGPRGTRRWRLQMPGELEVRAGESVKSPEHGETASASAAMPEPARSPRSTLEGVTPKASVSGELSPWAAVGATPGAGGGDKHTDEMVTRVSPESSLTIIEPPTRSGLSRSDIENANAKVTAMIAMSAQATYTNRDRIPEPYLAYADTYNALTGQVPTKRVLADWISTFSTWQAEGILVTHVRQAIEASRGRFTVVRPGSLTDTAAAMRARAAVSTGRGQRVGWTATLIADFQIKIDRSRRIQAEWYRSRGMAFEDPETMRPLVADFPRLLDPEPEELAATQTADDVRAKIGELAKSLDSRSS